MTFRLALPLLSLLALAACTDEESVMVFNDNEDTAAEEACETDVETEDCEDALDAIEQEMDDLQDDYLDALEALQEEAEALEESCGS